MEIGAQLYTLRDFCKTTEAFAETLRRVADIAIKRCRCPALVPMIPHG